MSCGQCMPCRVNKKREWTHRIVLESMCHSESSFVTLTYSEENLPHDGSLKPEHLTLFLKRFRKSIAPIRVRYFAVGEYGDESQRPHYHVALFGYPPCRKGGTNPRRSGGCCDICDRLRDEWSCGIIYSGDLSYHSAAYVAGYVTKKLTKKDDPRLAGRHPEFTRMSLRPGIGYWAMAEVASSILQHNLEDQIDVPVALRLGGKEWPLGKYLRKALRKQIGRDEKTPQAVLDQQKEELRPVWELAESSVAAGMRELFVKAYLENESKVAARQIEARERRNRKKVRI